MRKIAIIAVLFFIIVTSSFSQTEKKSDWLTKLDKLNITTSFNVQIWAVYTQGTDVYDTNKKAYSAVGDRLNFTLHRSRYGINAQPYKNLKFNFTFAADFIGRDAYSALDGGQNNGANPAFRLWQTYFQLRTKSESEQGFLTVGYFTPRIGRESLTNPLQSTSMEKAWSQNYLRRHLTGIGPGRAVGLNYGGLFFKEGHFVSMQYDFGLFTPVYQAVGGNSQGSQASPLLVGRTVWMFGDPESKKYSMGCKPNHFGKRNGLSIGLSFATEGNTDLYENSLSYGTDFLLNWGQLNVDGDWHIMTRKANDVDGKDKSVANTGYIRVSYNLPLKNGFTLEPVASLAQYNGEMEAIGQILSAHTGMPAGEDQYLDVGFNFYFNPDLKLALHYTFRDGDPGAAGDGTTINNYFLSGAGAVRHGDWLGLGVSAIF